MKTRITTQYPHESLNQALSVLLARQVVAFLVFTLAFAVPLSCQQHGTMSLLDLDGHVHDAHVDLAVPQEPELSPVRQDKGSPCSFHEHQTTADMALSALVGIAPTRLVCLPSPIGKSLPIDGHYLVAEHNPNPPDHPPRVL